MYEFLDSLEKRYGTLAAGSVLVLFGLATAWLIAVVVVLLLVYGLEWVLFTPFLYPLFILARYFYDTSISKS